MLKLLDKLKELFLYFGQIGSLFLEIIFRIFTGKKRIRQVIIQMMILGVEGLPIVDHEKCIGDGACAKICPRKIITMEPFISERMLTIACSNRDSGRVVKAVCKAGCIACKMCARNCSLFRMDENLAVLDYEHYTTDALECMKKAQEKCPTNIIISVGT